MTGPERAELMVCRLSREIVDGDVVGVGLGTPMALAAALMARAGDRPGAHVLVAGALSPEASVTTCMRGATGLADRTAAFVSHIETMEMAERGAMTMQFLRPAEVDGAGNANLSRVVANDGSIRRMVGGLAFADVFRIMPRVVLYHPDHLPRSLPERVAFVTGAGGGDAVGGTRGPVRLITDRAVFGFGSGAVRLESLHPGEDLDEVRALTGFSFDVETRGPAVTATPTAAELAALRRVDPDALRELELRETRTDAARRLAEVH